MLAILLVACHLPHQPLPVHHYYYLPDQRQQPVRFRMLPLLLAIRKTPQSTTVQLPSFSGPLSQFCMEHCLQWLPHPATRGNTLYHIQYYSMGWPPHRFRVHPWWQCLLQLALHPAVLLVLPHLGHLSFPLQQLTEYLHRAPL